MILEAILKPLTTAGIFAVLGLLVFVLGFLVMDKMTPWHLWSEIVEKQNRAVAILVGFMSLSVAIVIAAAIHG